MSLVISVHTSFPCAHACDDDIASSRSDASSKASIVRIVCSINSRIASRTVAAMCSSLRDPPPIAISGRGAVAAHRNTGDLRVRRQAQRPAWCAEVGRRRGRPILRWRAMPERGWPATPTATPAPSRKGRSEPGAGAARAGAGLRAHPLLVLLLGLEQVLQLSERFGVLGGRRRIITPGIGPLQCADHRASPRDGGAAVVAFAHYITRGTCHDVTGEAIAAESVDDVGKASLSDVRSILGD